MSAAGETGLTQTKRLVVTALVLSLLSVVLSLVVVAVMVYTTSEGRELVSRVEELETKLEREGEISSICLLAPDPGPCSSSVRRYYYLPRLSDCIQFPWGGCQGNHNNFLTLLQCRETCGVSTSTSSSPLLSPVLPSTVSPPARSRPAPDCLLAPDSGPCTDRLQRFYFDSQSKQCQSFDYGGCVGNGNNHFTLSDCQRRCSAPPRGRAKLRPQLCLMTAEAGRCSWWEERYHWDQEAGQCRTFNWSGCGGNSNNFRTQEKCVFRCGL